MSLFWSVLQNALIMSALVGILLMLRAKLWTRIKPSFAYAMGIILAIGLLIPVRPAVPDTLFGMTTTPWQPQAQEPMPEQDLPSMITGTGVDIDNLDGSEERYVPAPKKAVPEETFLQRVDPWEVVAIVWLVGSAMMALVYTGRQIYFHRMLRRWQGRPSLRDICLLHEACTEMRIEYAPRLWRCDFIQSPMLVGLFRPVLLLPRTMDDEMELRLVIRHELVHLGRHDLWLKAVAMAATCVHWFNPIVWMLARAISADCEMSCDDVVLAGADMDRRRLYGETILGVIERGQSTRALLSTHFYEGRMNMKRRFASMLDIRPKRAGLALIVLALVLTLTSGAVLAVAPEQVEAGTPIVIREGISPTTGMKYPPGRGTAYRPVLVNVSNSEEARPQLNLALADIVYEFIVWGPMHTRYLALYNDYHPELVCSVRGSRVVEMELRQQWDCPIIHMGGQDTPGTSIYAAMEEMNVPAGMSLDGVYSAGQARKVFGRIDERVNPHNAYGNVRQVVESEWPVDIKTGKPYEPKMPNLTFAKGTVEGSERANEIALVYDPTTYMAEYHFNPETGVYERKYTGAPHMDGITRTQITASNVIVQYADLSYHENSMARPIIDTVGEGRIDAFIDGWHIEGTWHRPTVDDQTEFRDMKGNPLLLKPGKTFIQIVPPDMSVIYDVA